MSNNYNFSVPDMSCGHCKMRISQALTDAAGVGDFSVDLDTKVVSVSADIGADAVIELIDEAGYDAVLLG
jgi:copper chaperone